MAKTKKNNDIEKKEKTFDEAYKEQFSEMKDGMEGINIVCEKLKLKYEDYEYTEIFIEYLRSVETVFMHAEQGNWSVERTQDEMIKGEIYIIAQDTGIDEEIFLNIYEEFRLVKNDVDKIDEIAKRLMDKYSNIEDCLECEDCKQFIEYVKESLLLFSKTFSGDEGFDEVSEVKEEAIFIKMKMIARDGKPPIEVLKEIYDEFLNKLKK